MYQIIALFLGVLLTATIPLNGEVAAHTGVYFSSVLVCIASAVFSAIYLLLAKQPLFPKKKLPLVKYTGGIFGICTIVFNNYAFGKISMLTITALCLLSQMLSSIAADSLGLFGSKKTSPDKTLLYSLIPAAIGVVIMMSGNEMSSVTAMIIAFASGISIVLSRVISADLARDVGAVGSSFINYLVGIPAVIVVLLILGRGELSVAQVSSVPVWAYLGAAAGVASLALSNAVLQKLSAFQFALLVFVGQVFSGIAVDLIMQQGIDIKNLAGGLLVAAGVAVNNFIPHNKKLTE